MAIETEVASSYEPGTFGSVVLGLVEGLTEFLPVSSTGHLIVTNRLLGGEDPQYEVVIQAGAITAVVVLYHARLIAALKGMFGRRAASSESGDGVAEPQTNLFWLLAIASIPAVVIGLSFKDQIEEWLFNPTVVGTTLVVGGFLLLWLERFLDRREIEPRSIDEIGLVDAFKIGLFQVLAMMPGTSRSGATIGGALILGYRRTAAAEFSFLLGLPILYGACLKQLRDDWDRLTGPLLDDILIGSIASFIAALVIVKPFVRFLERHSFRPFAWYRIVAGIVVLALTFSGYLATDAA
ncbi:MAG: undecaprenyl-diphosphate phosphatase [Planctomycetota bacterium]